MRVANIYMYIYYDPSRHPPPTLAKEKFLRAEQIWNYVSFENEKRRRRCAELPKIRLNQNLNGMKRATNICWTNTNEHVNLFQRHEEVTA